MATELARQLQKLKVPATSELLKEKRTPASLLFDSKQAFQYDKDTYYEIGISGLDELEILLPEFSKFRTTLFDETSKLLERTQFTKTENEKLDVNIKHFLTLVCPFALLKPAQKAIEWLVYRFHIHEFNSAEFLMCFLPYHQTKVFARVLQITDLKNAGKMWMWLGASQKANTSLATLTLYNHCVSNFSFLVYVCKFAARASKVKEFQSAGCLRNITTFYSTVVLGTIEYSSSVSENLLTTLLPYVDLGLESQAPDFVASTYIILSHLANRVLVKPTLFEPVLVKLLKNATSQMMAESVKCFVIVVQAQQWKVIPVALTALLQSKPLCEQLGWLSQTHNVTLVTGALVSSLLDKTEFSSSKALTGSKTIFGGKKWLTSIEKMLSMFRLDAEAVDQIVGRLFSLTKRVVKRSKGPKDEMIKSHIIYLLDILEKRYPETFDDSLKRCLAKSANKDVLDSLFSCRQSNPDVALTSVDHIFLNHPDATRRQIAVKQLMNSEKLKDGEIEPEVLQAVLARLQDDDPLVVSAVLSSPLLAQNMTSTIIAQVVRLILTDTAGNEWRLVKSLAIESLGRLNSVSPVVYKGAITAVFQWIFSFDVDNLGLAELLLSGKLGSSIPVLSLLKPGGDLKGKDATSHHASKLELLSRKLPKLDFEKRLELLTILLDSETSRQDHFGWFSDVVLPLVLGEIVKSEPLAHNRLKLADAILPYIGNKLESCTKTSLSQFDWAQTSRSVYGKACTTKAVKEEDRRLEIANSAKSKEFGSLLFCLGKVIVAVSLKCTGDCQPDDVSKLTRKLFDLVTRLANGPIPCPVALAYWYKSNFSDRQDLAKFLVATFSSCIDGDDKDTLCSIRCMTMLRDCLGTLNSHNFPDIVVPTLLLVLQSPYKVARVVSLQCLAVIHKILKSSTNVYVSLLEAVLRRSREIEDDPSYVHDFLVDYFAAAYENQLRALDVILNLITDDDAVLDTVKCGMLSCLAGIQTERVLIKLIPMLSSILVDTSRPLLAAKHSMARSIIKMFCPATVAVFVNSASALSSFELAIKYDYPPAQSSMPTLQLVALGQVTKDLFKSLPGITIQQNFLRMLIDEKIVVKDPTASKELSKILKKLLFNGELILVELQRANVKRAEVAKTVKGVKLDRQKQSSKSSSVSQKASSTGIKVVTGSPMDSVDNSRVIVVLEAIQRKRQIEKFEILIPIVFGYLQRVLEASQDYETQLVLENLINFCNQLLEAKTDSEYELLGESHFHVESIVSCIRSSRNPRIHQHALQLLAKIAQLYPEHVLHNTMAIFTFMGNNSLRQDDSYSFDIIISTVQNVVPPIMENCRSKLGTNKARDTAINLSRIFVDALPDIAPHRRIVLFKSLFSALEGDSDLLFCLFSLIVQRCVTWSGTAQEKSREKVNTDRKSMIEFALQFCNGFQLDKQLNCCIQLIEHLNRLDELPVQGENLATPLQSANKKNSKEADGDILFQLISPSHIRHHRLIVIEFISSLLSNPSFLSLIVDSSPNDVEILKTACPALLKESLTNLRINQGKDEKDAGSAKYWKVLQHRSLELCDRIIALLSDFDFVEVIEKLLKDENISIRRKALDMLSAKLQQNQKGSLSNDKVNCFLAVLPPLLAIASPSSIAQLAIEDELLIERQVSFVALRHLCHLLAPNHSEHLNDVVSTVMVVVCSSDEHEAVLSGAILCLAELCRGLRVQMFSHLPRFMPALTKIVHDVPNIFRQELLLLSTVTAIHRSVEAMPQFLSPYLSNILLKVCEMSILCPENPKSPLLSRLACIRQNISNEVEARVLFPAVQSCYRQLVLEQKESSVKFLMTVLGDSISRMNPKDAADWQEAFLPFFLEIFDYRLKNSQKDEKEIAVIEESVLIPILALVPKLSETTFRPFFIKFFDWATRPDAPFDRCIVFYTVADTIADKLKSLFVLFAGLFIKNSATMLDLNNKINTANLDFQNRDGQKRLLLLKRIIDCLQKTFLHDSERFVNRERFDTLLNPLVNQIDNDLGSDADYSDLILNHLKACLAQLAVATAGEMLWKQLNHAVLLKSRSSSSKVRFASLQILRDIARNIGEDYMTVIPEAIPFLAELLEDESVEVEQLCRAVIQDMEAVLGESMQKYF